MSDSRFTWFERPLAERLVSGAYSGRNAAGSGVLLKDGPDALFYFAGMAAMVCVTAISMLPTVTAAVIVAEFGTKAATYWTAATLLALLLFQVGWLDWRFVQYSKARRRFHATA